MDIDEPQLPRKRTVASQFEIGAPDTNHCLATAKEFYRQIYFDAYDHVINSLANHFDQPDFHTYIKIQELFLKSIQGEPSEAEFKAAIAMYGDDLDAYKLKPQLGLLPQMVRVSEFEQIGFDFDDLIKFLKYLDNFEKLLLSKVLVLAKLLTVIPATNAVSERSFSTLRRVKTYLRATTTDSRPNNLMILLFTRRRQITLTWLIQQIDLLQIMIAVAIFLVDLPWLISPRKHY